MSIGSYIFIGVILVVIIVFITLFNKLSKQRNQIENAISSLDALFIQRSDLIPNLVESVKQYVDFEKNTLEKITELRNPKLVEINKNPYLQPEEGVNILKQLMVQVENYPDLKANEQFRFLNQSFDECEQLIAAGRRYLSASITDYNDSVSVFPSNIIARIFNFKKYQWQYATQTQREAPKASELFKSWYEI